MRKAREVLRLRWGLRLSQREVAESLRISQSTVHDYCARAHAAGLEWAEAAELSEEALDARLFPKTPSHGVQRPVPDYATIYRELRRKGVTLQLLWIEYRERHPDGYGYAQFCNLYRDWRKQIDVTMRQEHKAGEKLFVDFAGQTVDVVNPQTGEVTSYPVFVAAFGVSNYTFAWVCRGQDLRSWIDAHVRAFEFFGGIPEVTVPDNLKSGVTKPCFYDPDINRTYQELAEHYDTVVIPTRVRKPRDKAKVENAVLQVERWLLAPLRHHTFFSLEEVQEAMAERLKWLNNRPLSKLDGTRRSLFEELDLPALKPLPRNRFAMAEWKEDVGVNIDHHVEFEGCFYSVPYQLVNQRVSVRATSMTVECFHRNRRVASHLRSYKKGYSSSKPEHRPKAHQQHLEWSPSRLICWAETIGPHTGQVVQHILTTKRHPEQGYRSVLGIIRMGKTYGKERLEKACHRAIATRAVTYRSIKSILKTGLDNRPLPQPEQLCLPQHSNVRGPDYYH